MVDDTPAPGEGGDNAARVKKSSTRRHIAVDHRLLTDDRGVEHVRVRALEMGDADERTRYALQLAEQTGAAQGPSMARVLIVAYLMALLLVVALLFTGLIAVPYLFVGIIAATFLTAFAFAFRSQRRKWRRGAALYADVMLANGLCPACAYRVNGLPTQRDGVVLCAECGAAWRHGRIGEPAGAPVWKDQDALRIERFVGKSMFWSGRRIRDALGHERILLDADFPKAIRLAEGPEHRERLREARRVLSRSAWLRRLIAGLFSAWILYFMFRAQISTFPSLGGPLTPGGVARMIFGVFVLGWVVVLAFYFLNPRGHSANKPRAIREMLRRRLCPSCGGEMSAAEPDDQNRVECPRCRAPWRIPLGFDWATPDRRSSTQDPGAHRTPASASDDSDRSS